MSRRSVAHDGLMHCTAHNKPLEHNQQMLTSMSTIQCQQYPCNMHTSIVSDEAQLAHACGDVRHAVHRCRYKAKEIESFRAKVPLAALQAAVKKAEPARDFKAALLKRAKETGVRLETFHWTDCNALTSRTTRRQGQHI